MMNEPYIILSGCGFDRIQKEVSDSIQDGYVPLGGPFLDNDANGDFDYIYQAMIKKENSQ